MLANLNFKLHRIANFQEELIYLIPYIWLVSILCNIFERLKINICFVLRVVFDSWSRIAVVSSVILCCGRRHESHVGCAWVSLHACLTGSLNVRLRRITRVRFQKQTKKDPREIYYECDIFIATIEKLQCCTIIADIHCRMSGRWLGKIREMTLSYNATKNLSFFKKSFQRTKRIMSWGNCT